MRYFEKKLQNMKQVFQRDTVNTFGNPKFTSVCLLDKDLIYIATNDDVYQLHLQRMVLVCMQKLY